MVWVGGVQEPCDLIAVGVERGPLPSRSPKHRRTWRPPATRRPTTASGTTPYAPAATVTRVSAGECLAPLGQPTRCHWTPSKSSGFPRDGICASGSGCDARTGTRRTTDPPTALHDALAAAVYTVHAYAPPAALALRAQDADPGCPYRFAAARPALERSCLLCEPPTRLAPMTRLAPPNLSNHDVEAESR